MEVRPLVDGEDVLAAEVFTEGPCEDPGYLLLPDAPLTAGTEPHEVRLAEAGCTKGCCGALYVTVRRDGDHVIWSEWRNPGENVVGLPEFRFDAEEYQAEVERAVADRSWEWPARTVARLLELDLRERSDWLARWECELGGVSAWLWEPGQIDLFLFHPGRSAIRESRPWLQFRLVLDVSSDAPEVQARRLAEQLVASDPRQTGEVCGGSPEYARQLSHPWPQRRRG
ncbi:hypothetical protein GCM10012287_03640 [Streptomyces daqingensis]|uniref:Uncharacterized protein n=1 Tax=Streptomyces daqingensis TaxID=1472640 RepID=A0ABQ2LSF3_9ACTN|nr:hypothetical protein [Streptomyces daqingensis]GGO42525.1 hypothetical protein GCM10012287_03640 [Streptomyces daqingensis]